MRKFEKRCKQTDFVEGVREKGIGICGVRKQKGQGQGNKTDQIHYVYALIHQEGYNHCMWQTYTKNKNKSSLLF